MLPLNLRKSAQQLLSQTYFSSCILSVDGALVHSAKDTRGHKVQGPSTPIFTEKKVYKGVIEHLWEILYGAGSGFPLFAPRSILCLFRRPTPIDWVTQAPLQANWLLESESQWEEDIRGKEREVRVFVPCSCPLQH